MQLRRWIESGAWAAGIVLCVVYASARLGFERARTRGIESARQASVLPGEPTSLSAPEQPTAPVDQHLWSRQRIVAFARSLTTPGAPEGILRIPSIGLEVPVYSGTSELNLDRGAAHVEGTAALAAAGNIGIAGHRDGFFRKLKDLTIDGQVELEVHGRTLRYRVSEILIVPPSQMSVLGPTATPTITLVTCYPFYFVGNAPMRYIVRAELSDAGSVSSHTT